MNKIYIAFMVAFFIAVAFGFKHQIDDSQNINEKCKKTEMFVFDSKGHRAVVYDCTGVQL